MLSRTQIDKLGDRLRRCEVPADDDLRLLSDLREERRSAMEAVGAGLEEILVTVPARRLKTINSIVDKLRRESARLSQVQGIAGLRIVREMSRVEQDDLVSRILARFPDAKVSDRRASPSHGYRAVHVIVTYDRHLAEVQVRADLQHRWAMLVERFADAWGQQIKYGEGPGAGSYDSRAAVVSMLHEVSAALDRFERQTRDMPLAPDGQVADEIIRLRQRFHTFFDQLASVPV